MGWTNPVHIFKRPLENLLGLILFLFSFSFFLWYLCPSLYWRDPGEFVAIAFTLSVGHPTGSPTYSLIAKLFTFLPWGSLFQKINLVSAVFGALTIYLVYRMSLLLLGGEEAGSPRRGFWVIFSGGLILYVIIISRYRINYGKGQPLAPED